MCFDVCVQISAVDKPNSGSPESAAGWQREMRSLALSVSSRGIEQLRAGRDGLTRARTTDGNLDELGDRPGEGDR